MDFYSSTVKLTCNVRIRVACGHVRTKHGSGKIVKERKLKEDLPKVIKR